MYAPYPTYFLSCSLSLCCLFCAFPFLGIDFRLFPLSFRAETLITGTTASVLKYDNVNRAWAAAGPGPSRVEIYRNPTTNVYRVVARHVRDSAVTINTLLYPMLEYRRATDTFHQWQDSSCVYGLNFTSKDDANIFGTAMEKSVQSVTAAAASKAPAPAPISSTSPSVSASASSSSLSREEPVEQPQKQKPNAAIYQTLPARGRAAGVLAQGLVGEAQPPMMPDQDVSSTAPGTQMEEVPPPPSMAEQLASVKLRKRPTVVEDSFTAPEPAAPIKHDNFQADLMSKLKKREDSIAAAEPAKEAPKEVVKEVVKETPKELPKEVKETSKESPKEAAKDAAQAPTKKEKLKEKDSGEKKEKKSSTKASSDDKKTITALSEEIAELREMLAGEMDVMRETLIAEMRAEMASLRLEIVQAIVAALS